MPLQTNVGAIKEYDSSPGTHFYTHQPNTNATDVIELHKQILRTENLMPTKVDLRDGHVSEDCHATLAKADAAAKQLKAVLKWRWLASGAVVTLLPRLGA